MISKEKIKHRANQVSDAIRSLDLFQQPIPGFNIKGKTSEGTYLGSLVSISLIVVMILYGAIKFNILANRVNPTITFEEELQEFDDEMTHVNLREDTSMRFAFSVRSVDDKKTLMDPRYVKIITRLVTRDADGNESEQMIGHHACTDEDWALFAPPSAQAAS